MLMSQTVNCNINICALRILLPGHHAILLLLSEEQQRSYTALHVKQDQVITPFSNIPDLRISLNMLNGIPVLNLCLSYIRVNLHQCLYCFSSHFFSSLLPLFSFGETSGIKAECFNKQGKRCLVSLYQINREQKCLIKLHLSRNDIRKT